MEQIKNEWSELEGDFEAQMLADSVEQPKPESFLQYAAQTEIKPHKCYACGGSGRFRSKYTGRDVGECFTCGGAGVTTKNPRKPLDMSPEAVARRQKAKAQREATKRGREADHQALVDDWKARNADMYQYLMRQVAEQTRISGFAQSLLAGLQQYGRPTDGQMNAVDNMMERARQWEAEKEAKRQAAALSAGIKDPEALDISGLQSGYYAVPDGDSRLKVAVRRPKEHSRWHGYIFVDDGAAYGARQNYGRQAPGRLYEGKIRPQLRAIVANPKAAMQAYGQLTGVCGVCGRRLEDETSVKLGIGPICRMGWGLE